MIDKRTFRYIVFVFLMLSLALMTYILSIRENSTCLGIKITDSYNFENNQEIFVDLGDSFLINNTKATVSENNKTIYILQNINNSTTVRDLNGLLRLAHNEYDLFFLYDNLFNNLEKAVSENHKFTLLAVNDNKYIKYNVIFTTIPIINISGNIIGTTEEGRDIFSGDIILWETVDKFSHSIVAKQSNVEYHYRGGTTYYEDKKSYKLSLKSADNTNRNMEFCDMGKDDDWILNSMTYDDTKLREKVSMDLWNEIAHNTDYNYKMSTGSYVELVVNGVYEGVYLLQRRIDPKYLGLGDNDILLKGKPKYHIESIDEGYEIKYSNLPERETYNILNDIFINSDCLVYNLHNMVDISLFLEFGTMSDNISYKNMYYILKETNNQHEIYLVSWDTDMSFGIMWGNDFEVLTEKALGYTAIRREFNNKYLKQHPDINKLMEKRWKELRTNVFSTENISRHISHNYSCLVKSGAYIRNSEVEPLRYSGKDTKENIEYYISEKLKIMDKKYIHY